MLILIVERPDLDLYYKWHPDSALAFFKKRKNRAFFHFADNALIFFTILCPVSPHRLPSPIADKSKCWMGKTSTTNYCQPWSRSPRRSTRPPPPPARSSGPPVSQGLSLAPVSAGKTDAPDMLDRHSKEHPRCWMCCGMWSERGGRAE